MRKVGFLNIRKVDYSGQYSGSEKCLDIEVESQPPDWPAVLVGPDQAKGQAALDWLMLTVEISTINAPHRIIGRVDIPVEAMLQIEDVRRGPAQWRWVIHPEDVEIIERSRANQAASPLNLQVEIRGIAKVRSPDGAGFNDIAALRGFSRQLIIEHSQWERLLVDLEYKLPPSHASLAGLSSLDDPSWALAAEALNSARNHHRSGEDYDALNACLSMFEAVVSAPYNLASWKTRLQGLPDQKADSIAELLSGLATYCNRVGHHRSRQDRADSGDLAQMPVDHWEADLVLGAAQFLLTYAKRLRLAGILADPPPKAGDSG